MKSNTQIFIHANVIPMDDECVLYDQTLIAQNGCITQIGGSAPSPVPVNAIQIDASDKSLIPVLADMPVHLEGDGWNIMFPPETQFYTDDLDFEQILSPYIANGITTIQVMSALPEHIVLRDQINRE